MSDTPPTHWLYPVNATTDSRINTPDGLEPVSLAAFRRLDFGQLSVWGLRSGHRTMRPGDLVWVYFSRPESALGALGRVVTVRPDASGAGHEAVLSWDRPATTALVAAPIPLSRLGRAPRAVRRADPGLAELLRDWLSEHDLAA